jgi:integrase
MKEAKQRRGQKGGVSLFKPDGCATWWIRYTVDGKQKRQNTGKASEADAKSFAAQISGFLGYANSTDLNEQRRLLDILREIVATLPALQVEAAQFAGNKSATTCREWFAKAIAEMEHNTSGDDRNVKAATSGRIGQVFNDWLKFLEAQPTNLADAPLNRISADVVKAFLVQLKEQGLAGSTRRFALARIRAVLGQAVNTGLLVQNPASAKATGKLKFYANSIKLHFTPRQVAAILEACDKSTVPGLKLSAMLAYFTGQRSGDICAMMWNDIRNLGGAVATIDLTQRKTGAAVTIPLAEPLRQALLAVPEDQRTGHLLPDAVAEGYLAGRKRMFQRPWRDLLDALPMAELSERPVRLTIKGTGERGRSRNAYSYHSWRHTTASYVSGADSHYLLGHRTEEEKRLGTTQQYRHEDLLRLKAQLDALPLGAPANVVEMKMAKGGTR